MEVKIRRFCYARYLIEFRMYRGDLTLEIQNFAVLKNALSTFNYASIRIVSKR